MKWDGDLDRAKRKQNALRSLRGKASQSASDPVALFRLIDATSRTASVDDTLTNGGLRDLALANRDLRPGALTFASAPVGSFGREGAQAVDYLDPVGSAELWAAIRNGTVADYVVAHPSTGLGATPS